MDTYCEVSDLKRILRVDEGSFGIGDVSTANGNVISEADVAEYIRESTAYINIELQDTYDTPLELSNDTTKLIIRKICSLDAGYRILTDTESVGEELMARAREWRDIVKDFFDRIRNGQIILPGQDYASETTDAEREAGEPAILTYYPMFDSIGVESERVVIEDDDYISEIDDEEKEI